MSDYTPSEARICIDYCNAAIRRPAPDGSFMSMEDAHDAFDRWLAAHDAEIAAKALEDAAKEIRDFHSEYHASGLLEDLAVKFREASNE